LAKLVLDEKDLTAKNGRVPMFQRKSSKMLQQDQKTVRWVPESTQTQSERQWTFDHFQAVLDIRDILVRIRIRICTSD
jgi:hypothetical protein